MYYILNFYSSAVNNFYIFKVIQIKTKMSILNGLKIYWIYNDA